MFQDASRNYWMPMQYLISRLTIVANFLILKKNVHMPVLSLFIIGGLAFVTNSIETILLLVFARSQKHSKKCINSWRYPQCRNSFAFVDTDVKRNHNFAYFIRFRKSCKPIAIKFGSFYVVTPKSVMKYYVNILRGTIRLLLAI